MILIISIIIYLIIGCIFMGINVFTNKNINPIEIKEKELDSFVVFWPIFLFTFIKGKKPN